MNKELKKIIQSDFFRYYGEGGGYHFMWSLLNHSLKCIVTYRKANYYAKHNKLLYLYYTYRLKVLDKKYAFHIPAMAEIGEGFFIGHNGPIIINTNAKIGKNCNIATGVTIGRENRGKREGAPTIGYKVWIGTNAVVVGKVTIGDNVLIAPNAYVNFDVPSNSIVIGNPGKIIENRPDATQGYCHNLFAVSSSENSC